MGAGLATSMAYTGYAFVLTGVVCALLLALHFLHPFSQPLLLRVTIPEDLDYTGVFDDLFAAHAPLASGGGQDHRYGQPV